VHQSRAPSASERPPVPRLDGRGDISSPTTDVGDTRNQSLPPTSSIPVDARASRPTQKPDDRRTGGQEDDPAQVREVGGGTKASDQATGVRPPRSRPCRSRTGGSVQPPAIGRSGSKDPRGRLSNELAMPASGNSLGTDQDRDEPPKDRGPGRDTPSRTSPGQNNSGRDDHSTRQHGRGGRGP
jgi:hypothetical protein